MEKCFKIIVSKIRLLPKSKVVFNPNPKIVYFRWDFVNPYGKIPVYTNSDFIRLYRNRFLLTKEQRK